MEVQGNAVVLHRNSCSRLVLVPLVPSVAASLVQTVVFLLLPVRNKNRSGHANAKHYELLL